MRGGDGKLFWLNFSLKMGIFFSFKKQFSFKSINGISYYQSFETLVNKGFQRIGYRY